MHRLAGPRASADQDLPGVVDEGPHDVWREDWIDRDAGIVRRPLTDGSVHRAVKVIWRTDELARRLHELGWDASDTAEGPFYWGVAHRT